MVFPIKCVLLVVRSCSWVISKRTCIFSLLFDDYSLALILARRVHECRIILFTFFFFFSHFSLDGTMVFYFFSSSFNFCLENGEEKKKFCISIPLVYMIFPSFNYAIHWLYGFCVAISLYTLYTLIERWLFACSSTHFGIYTCITP